MKNLFLAFVFVASNMSFIIANQVANPEKELLEHIAAITQTLVSIGQELPAQKQQEFQMLLQQLLQLVMAQLQMPMMQEEIEELIRTKVSPAKYAQLQKLQKLVMDKIEKATAPLKKDATVLDKKIQTLTQKILNDNASAVKQMEALQAQIQVELEQYMQMQQAALQSNAVLP